MKKKVLFVLVLFMIIGIANVFADNFRTGTYALPGTDITMQFTGSSTGGRVILAYGGETWNAGTYSVDGERLILRLERTTNQAFRELSGLNLVLRIASNGDIYDGGAQWVKIR